MALNNDHLSLTSPQTMTNIKQLNRQTIFLPAGAYNKRLDNTFTWPRSRYIASLRLAPLSLIAISVGSTLLQNKMLNRDTAVEHVFI